MGVSNKSFLPQIGCGAKSGPGFMFCKQNPSVFRTTEIILATETDPFRVDRAGGCYDIRVVKRDLKGSGTGDSLVARFQSQLKRLLILPWFHREGMHD